MLLKRLHQTEASLKSPFLLKQRSSAWYTTTTISLGIFTDSFTYAVVVPILPYTLPSRAGVEVDQTQLWTTILVACYGGALLVGSPIVGLIAGKTKTRRRPYMFSLLLLASAASGLCFGRNVIVLLFARALQGLSAALVWTAGLALLSDRVEGRSIGRAMGFAALGSSNAILLGLLLGGIIYERMGYQSIFYICFSLMLIDMVLRLVLIEAKTAEEWLTADNTTRSSQSESEAGINDVCDRTSGPKNATGDAGARSSSFPSSRLMCALFSTFISAVLISSFEAVIPLHIKTVFGWSSSRTGMLFAALVVPNFLSPLIGSLSDQLGIRWVICTGYALFCPLLIGLCLARVDSIAGITLFCFLLAGLGTCYSMVNVPVLGEYKNIVVERETAILTIPKSNNAYAQAYGMYNMAYSTGILIGPIASGFMVQKVGFEMLMGVLALTCASTAVVTAVWSGSRSGSRHGRQAHAESDAPETVQV